MSTWQGNFFLSQVMLRETPEGAHERHSPCSALSSKKNKDPGIYHDHYLCQLYRNQAVMIGQSLLEFGWLEPVPNAREGGTVFKDEYVLYQPGMVNSEKTLFGSISRQKATKSVPIGFTF